MQDTNYKPIHSHPSKKATGPLKVNMTNDVLFHLLMQKNERLLRAILCSLLRMDPSQIESVEIQNPIRLGEKLGDKKFELDVLIHLNNNTFLDLEMQVVNEHDWPERTLSYSGRQLNHLRSGASYLTLKPVIHIGIMDYTIFPNHPEFFATYQLTNIKSHHVFSDKLTIHVLDLSQTELATEEDKAYHLDYWAAFFRSKTWEELHMLAEKNSVFEEAEETIYDFCQNDEIIQNISAREDAIRTANGFRQLLAEKDALLSQKDAQISQRDAQISQKDAQISQKDAQITELLERLKKYEQP